MELCKVVYDASPTLKHKSAMKEFREQNKLQDKGTFSQYRTIGQHYNRLNPHASSLPSSWYSLYKIARLAPAAFTAAVANQTIHPFVTQRDIRELSGTKKAPQSKKSDTLSYVIELGETDAERVKESDDEVEIFAKELVAEFGFAFNAQRSAALKTMLKQSPALKSAA